MMYTSGHMLQDPILISTWSGHWPSEAVCGTGQAGHETLDDLKKEGRKGGCPRKGHENVEGPLGKISKTHLFSEKHLKQLCSEGWWDLEFWFSINYQDFSILNICIDLLSFNYAKNSFNSDYSSQEFDLFNIARYIPVSYVISHYLGIIFKQIFWQQESCNEEVQCTGIP